MTIENRQFIDLEEIISIQYECKNCHSTLTVPRERWGAYVQLCCPRCGAIPSQSTVWIDRDSDEYKELLTLQRSLNELIKFQEMKCKLRLEVRPSQAQQPGPNQSG